LRNWGTGFHNDTKIRKIDQKTSCARGFEVLAEMIEEIFTKFHRFFGHFPSNSHYAKKNFVPPNSHYGFFAISV